MRLETLKYKDTVSGWELSQTEFFPDLTLLVGVSGVGKTKVLQAIGELRAFAKGGSQPGAQWEATFVGNDGGRYLWRGGFMQLSDAEPPADATASNAPFEYEELQRDGSTLIKRDAGGILLRGQKIPKLSPFQSALMLLSQEQDIAEAYTSCDRILGHWDEEVPLLDFDLSSRFTNFRNKIKTLDGIRYSYISTRIKLFLLHGAAPDTFARIIERFKDIFPNVEDVKVEVRGFAEDSEWPVLKIKESGCERWIEEHEVSSGMRRTLYHLARLELWPDGTLVLIDEFEDSLGVNCLDVLTREVVSSSQRIQFIVTSHHPYIINNINSQHWKILTRKGPVVTAHDAVDLGIGRSNHQAFIQLLNAERFRDGIEVP